jgi:mycothiol synthase
MQSMENLTLRGFMGKSDYEKMAKLLQAIFVADEAKAWTTAEDIERDYQHLTNSDPSTDMCLVVDAQDNLVAYARVFWNLDDDDRQVFGFPFNVHPEYRSIELNRHMLQWVQGRCAELAQGERPYMRTMLHNIEKDAQFRDALQLEGFKAVRYNYRMKRNLSAPIAAPHMPEGLQVRPATEEHYRAIVTAADEAFRDHWGHTPITPEAFEAYRVSPQFRPDLWQVAWDGDEIAGAILNFVDEHANKQFNIRRGWTDPIFTRRPWRKRGLARALLMRSLHMFKEMGLTEAALSVDTENPSGALGFYESCGFELESKSVFFEKEVEKSSNG